MIAVLDFLSYGVTHASIWQVVIYTLIVTHITIAAVTIFLHRCMAHRALELHAIPSHFFRFWLWMTTGMVTKEWAAIHRKHHAKCETVEDPHSPQVLGLKKLLLEGADLYRAEAKNKETMERYGHGTPDDWIERKLYTGHSALGVALMLIINWVLFGVGVGTVVWTVQMLWIPIMAAGIINGIGHFWGYRNFNCTDASTNISPWGILIGGEELHNNHHTFGSAAKLSNKWFEFDIGWMYIRILSALGLATVKKVPPKPKFTVAKAKVDLATLQAVIANRYDVSNKYAKSFKRVCAEELAKLREKHHFEAHLIKSVKQWLHKDAEQLNEADRAKLSEVLAKSKVLQMLYEMRQELNKLWARSSASSEQLLTHLHDWCAKAEASGNRSLQDFSVRLRSYA